MQSLANSATCKLVAAILANGPDPGADPVGYALAQIKPLTQLPTAPNAQLQHAVTTLAQAYQAFYASNGSTAAKSSVNHAVRALNHYCPGAASPL